MPCTNITQVPVNFPKRFSYPFQRGLCCFPGFTNPVTAQRKGKIPKPLLASVSGGGNGGGTVAMNAIYEPSAMVLLEKQGRTSQQQRGAETARCPAPSSLPRPPRRSGLPRRCDYNRLGESELPPSPRKKSDGGESLSSNASSRRASPARLLPPRKLGEYGRLSESGGSSQSIRKPRDSTSTLSDQSASSLPPPSKMKLFGSGAVRRGGSLGRDIKASSDTQSNKYRIQF